MRVAIVGSGIAGLTVAHRLHRDYHITLFEAADRIGGHTNTVDVELGGRSYAVDTGFIVFNDWTYPRFIALLEELGVEWQHSNMSFSLRSERSGLEYNGTSINALFAQRRNLLRPSFLRMIADILRFNTQAKELLTAEDDTLTLGEYLERARYSRPFVDHYIVPMGKAIWSATQSSMLSFPARFFVDFFARHGFLQVNDRPVWRTVTGGSREYVRKLVAPFGSQIRTGTRVTGVSRDAEGVTLRTARGDIDRFDYVFFACHSDQALAMLERPSAREEELLGAFPYQRNEAILHTDRSLLPRAPLARAAWNYHLLDRDQEPVALTYDMNILQSIESPESLLVTLNRADDIREDSVLRTFEYEHPVYLPRGAAAQKRRREISGVDRSFYCGAYWRYGFHEDGVVTAEAALEDFAEVTRGAHPASGGHAQAADAHDGSRRAAC